MSDTLTYNGILISRKDVMQSADNGRSMLNKAIVVRAVQEKIITLRDLHAQYSWMNENVLKQWMLDSEVIAFMPKILGPRKAAEEELPAPTAPKQSVPAHLEYRSLSLDADTGKLWWNERSVLLTHREKVALPLFFKSPETVITREAIHEAVTSRPYEKGVTLPDQVMTDARASFRTLGITPLPILKVRGGYKLTITH